MKCTQLQRRGSKQRTVSGSFYSSFHLLLFYWLINLIVIVNHPLFYCSSNLIRAIQINLIIIIIIKLLLLYSPFSASLSYVFPTESKNSSESHPISPDGVISSSDAATIIKSYPPFSRLMLIHIKGHQRLRSSVFVVPSSLCSGLYIYHWCLWWQVGGMSRCVWWSPLCGRWTVETASCWSLRSVASCGGESLPMNKREPRYHRGRAVVSRELKSDGV